MDLLSQAGLGTEIELYLGVWAHHITGGLKP